MGCDVAGGRGEGVVRVFWGATTIPFFSPFAQSITSATSEATLATAATAATAVRSSPAEIPAAATRDGIPRRQLVGPHSKCLPRQSRRPCSRAPTPAWSAQIMGPELVRVRRVSSRNGGMGT